VYWEKEEGNMSPTHVETHPAFGDDVYFDAGRVVITVQDSGPGLSKEQQLCLFQEGVQFNPNELQKGQGSGLGLWISREIMRQHRGVISVSSEGLGKGSTFKIVVPVMQPPHRDPTTVAVRSLNRKDTMERTKDKPLVPTKALVVDDAISNRKILSRLMEGAGVRVEQAENGLECLDLLQRCDPEEPFDLVVMDYEMPVLNGPDATQRLRDMGFTLPVIGVTGNVLPEDREHFMLCGANVVLPKPISLAILLESYRMVMHNITQEHAV
jgi:CheY-like chemotaxis protein